MNNRLLRAVATLTIFLALTPMLLSAGEAKRVRILMVIDTDADGAADFGAPLDRELLKNVLIKGIKQANLKFTINILQGTSATPKRILMHYEKLQTSPDEALMFYYTGHGCVDKNKGQMLAMKHGSLARADVRAAMLKHNPKLAVILTDCCSNGFSSGQPIPFEGALPAVKPVSRPESQGSVLRDLLFRHEGLVVVSAASVGQFSFGSSRKGGNFTIALCNLLGAPPSRFDKNKDGLVEWREFYPALRQETHRVSGARHTPQAYSLGQPFRP